MKRFFVVILTLCLALFAFSACTQTPTNPNSPSNPSSPSEPSDPSDPSSPSNPSDPSSPSNPSDPSSPSNPSDPSSPTGSKAYTMSEDGKTIYFGSYPTESVTDETVVSELNKLADEWTSYGYYAGGEVQDIMSYADVERGAEKYRGVRISNYRPFDTRSESSAERSFQDENGYVEGNTYWFRYETLSWRVLEKSGETALIASEKVLDSHEFYPASKGENGHKANNYETSSIRAFLVGEFYRAAFSEAEKTNIVGGDDNVFLLSYEQATTLFASDTERKLEATDYAKAQGLNSDGGARWWLSSANDTYDFYARYVDGSGYPEYNQYVYWCSLGVVPALKIRLFDSEKEVIDMIYLTIGTHKISVKLEENEATKALVELLKAGDISYSAHDYGGSSQAALLRLFVRKLANEPFMLACSSSHG